MKLLDIYRSLEPDLRTIEHGLEEAIDDEVPLLYEASTHLLKAGGKRIRPVFVLLAGKFGNYDLSQLSKVAVSLELIHMATLVHDDVIDDAATRRGKMTVKSKWDNKIAMYTGDYIFAKALMLITELENPRLHQILSSSIVELCKGEIEQIHDFYRTDLHFRQYLRRIKRKTAILIAISSQLGAMVSGANDEVVRHLRRYGYYIGMAFQVTDDILDFTGTEEQLGKPAGSDLKQGNITLPTIYALRYSPRKEELREKIESKQVGDDLPEMLEIIRESGGLEYSKEVANLYIRKAKEELSGLPSLPAKEQLQLIAEFIGKRNF